jgi:ketosteroid isomerase-like protein
MNYSEWLDRYRSAWIDRDADSAAALFTDDAIYREHPFEEPFVGREAIRRYWHTVTRPQSAIELRYGTPVVSGPRVAVEWWATLLKEGAPLTLAGEFLLVFADDGRCRELREYWAFTAAKVSPPNGWGS